MSLRKELSQKEISMFNHLGMGDLIDRFDSDDVIAFYRIAVDKCFLNEINNWASRSLRRAYKAIQMCNPYRRTALFDNLISDDHIHAVKVGDLVEDFIADKNGYVWFDEVGLLGVQRVYDTYADAQNALRKYCEEVLK